MLYYDTFLGLTVLGLCSRTVIPHCNLPSKLTRIIICPSIYPSWSNRSTTESTIHESKGLRGINDNPSLTKAGLTPLGESSLVLLNAYYLTEPRPSSTRKGLFMRQSGFHQWSAS